CFFAWRGRRRWGGEAAAHACVIDAVFGSGHTGRQLLRGEEEDGLAAWAGVVEIGAAATGAGGDQREAPLRVLVDIRLAVGRAGEELAGRVEEDPAVVCEEMLKIARCLIGAGSADLVLHNLTNARRRCGPCAARVTRNAAQLVAPGVEKEDLLVLFTGTGVCVVIAGEARHRVERDEPAVRGNSRCEFFQV